MKITPDTDSKKVVKETDGERVEFALYSKQAIELISHFRLKVGWNERYPYTFSWMGRPIISFPKT